MNHLGGGCYNLLRANLFKMIIMIQLMRKIKMMMKKKMLLHQLLIRDNGLSLILWTLVRNAKIMMLLELAQLGLVLY